MHMPVYSLGQAPSRIANRAMHFQLPVSDAMILDANRRASTTGF
jgi:hypothetical protein